MAPLNSIINTQKEKLPRTTSSKGGGITSSLNENRNEFYQSRFDKNSKWISSIYLDVMLYLCKRLHLYVRLSESVV